MPVTRGKHRRLQSSHTTNERKGHLEASIEKKAQEGISRPEEDREEEETMMINMITMTRKELEQNQIKRKKKRR